MATDTNITARSAEIAHDLYRTVMEYPDAIPEIFFDSTCADADELQARDTLQRLGVLEAAVPAPDEGPNAVMMAISKDWLVRDRFTTKYLLDRLTRRLINEVG
jgi:hypothetical protein